MKKLWLLLPIFLASCAPATTSTAPVASTTARYNMTCSNLIFQLSNASARLKPYPLTSRQARYWSVLTVQSWSDSDMVITSERSNLYRPYAFFDDARKLTLKANCAEVNRVATLTLTSTGLNQDVMNDLHTRLLSQINVF